MRVSAGLAGENKLRKAGTDCREDESRHFFVRRGARRFIARFVSSLAPAPILPEEVHMEGAQRSGASSGQPDMRRRFCVDSLGF